MPVTRSSDWSDAARRGIAIGLLLAAAAHPASAEVVAGFARDQTGGGVAGAKVALTDQSKRISFDTQTEPDGSFVFPAVPVGSYRIQAEKAGFQTFQMANIAVEVGRTTALDLTFILGDIRTVITVDSPSTSIDTDSNTLGAVVDQQRVRELPLNGREFLQLALLTGGAAEISPANNLYTSNIGPPTREITLPGTLPHSTGYVLNGFTLTGARDGELAAGISVAAIDQFKVHQSFLMPEQGAGLALVNVVTRTGAGEFHGEVFEFLRNRALDARSFFAAAPEDLKRNQFGLALGGPIWPDRMWFHGFYEGIRELTAFQAAGYSPTAAMFRGEMAETGRVIYDPLTFDASSGQRAPFAGAVIPAERINPVARRLLDYYRPGSSLASRPANVFGNPRNTLDDDQGGARIDVAPGSRHRLSFQYFKQSSAVDLPGLFPLSGNLYRNGFSLTALGHTWIVSPRLVNSFRAGFLRAQAVGGNESTAPLLASIGVANTYGDQGISTINPVGYSPFGNATGDVGNHDNTWEFHEQLSYMRSAHQIVIGAGLRRRRGWHQNSNRSALGVLSFQPTFTAQLARNAQGQTVPVAATGDSFADFLLGMPVTGIVSGLPPVEYHGTEFTPFVQDTWRINPRITLNYGVSWFLETPPDPRGWGRSNVHGFDTSSGLMLFASLGQLDPKVVATDRNNIAPRFGISWKPAGERDTVIRAGAGLYYSPMPWIATLFPLALGTPSSVGTPFANAPSAPLPAFQLGRNIFPPAPANVVTPDYAASLPAGTQVSALDPSLRSAYSTQWNLSVEHRIGRNDHVEVSYMGSSAHRLLVLTDLSQCVPRSDLFCSSSAKPWPRYGVVYWGTSSGNTSSQMLITRFGRRTQRGLNFRFEYTLGKTLSDVWESSLLPRAQIAACRACDKGPATFDVRHRAVGSVVWEPPLGKSRLAAGWTLTAITTFSTGQPVLFTGPNQTGSLFLNHLPNRVCDGRNGGLSGDIRNNGFVWFDRACFQTPPTGYFGNSGATVLNGPGLNNWDLGVGKLTRLDQRVGLQFRAEFFNAWNHAQFQPPNGNPGAGANFGRISAARRPRLIQFAMKVLW